MPSARLFLTALAALAASACHRRSVPPRAPAPTLAARLTATARAEFRGPAARALVQTADEGFRARGNEPFVRLLEAVESHLSAQGFARVSGAAPPDSLGTLRRAFSARDVPLWTPRSARLAMVSPLEATLLAFSPQADLARTMLVAGTRGGAVQGPLVLWPTENPVPDGALVLSATERAPTLERTLAARGFHPGAVLSAFLYPFNHPEQHPDAIHYDLLRTEAPEAVLVDVPPSLASQLQRAAERGPVTLRLEAEVTLARGDVPMVEACVQGSRPEAPPVLFIAHADEPGANDNGSGVGALAESAATMLRLVRSRAVPRPQRSVCFLFGMEMEASRAWLEQHPGREPFMALSVDMAGQPPEVAPALLERAPDPGTELALPGDEHTDWYDGPGPLPTTRDFWLNAVATRVFQSVERGWAVREHPFEGGSDHEIFLQRGLPAALLWHFPDDAYHTNRDRIDRTSTAELERVGAGVVTLGFLASLGTEECAEQGIALALDYARERLRRVREASSADAGAVSWSAHREHWVRSLRASLESARGLSLAPGARSQRALQRARAQLER